MSLCLGEVLAQATGTAHPTKVTDLPKPLLRIAQRVARNREVLGLHYPSDSEVGSFWGSKPSLIVKTGATMKALMAQAVTEWGSS